MTAPTRLAVPLAAALLGFLVVLAAEQREVPARGARRLEIVDLIGEQDARVRTLRAEVSMLQRELDSLSAGRERGAIARLRERAGVLSIRAGGSALSGPGVVVVLDDASGSRSPTGDPNDLLIHERDIQTVVNALWAAGAEAVALNGERLTSTSAVRCAGNTLLLHGALHTPPYELAAIGNAQALSAALAEQPGMRRLAAAAETFGLGYDVRNGPVRIPARELLPPLEEAVPA